MCLITLLFTEECGWSERFYYKDRQTGAINVPLKRTQIHKRDGVSTFSKIAATESRRCFWLRGERAGEGGGGGAFNRSLIQPELTAIVRACFRMSCVNFRHCGVCWPVLWADITVMMYWKSLKTSRLIYRPNFKIHNMRKKMIKTLWWSKQHQSAWGICYVTCDNQTARRGWVLLANILEPSPPWWNHQMLAANSASLHRLQRFSALSALLLLCNSVLNKCQRNLS